MANKKSVNKRGQKPSGGGNSGNGPKKLKKDPGIPSLLPFKDKLLRQAEATKKKAAEEKLRQQNDRKTLQSKNRPLTNATDLATLAQDAASRSHTFDASQPALEDSFSLGTAVDAAAAGLKDNSRKAYYREFKKVVENADVILEVLDARDPLGCRTRQIEEMVLNAGSDKRVILILNKIDLVPREIVEQWLKYLRNEFPTIAFKASTQNQRTNLGHSTISVDIASDRLLSTSECLGADNLMKLLKNYCRNANIKTAITVGVIGFPNVGKSSVINSLKRSKVCNVGSAPGVTKVAQTIQLDKGIKLLDCPGIVFSQSSRAGDEAEVLLRNCVKVELLDDPVSPVEVIVGRCDAGQLMKIYGVGAFGDTRDFLVQVARVRGKLRKGGIPDIESAARSILQDWNSGRIPFYTIPPQAGLPVASHVSAAIVESWSREFELPDVVETEGKDLASAAFAEREEDAMVVEGVVYDVGGEEQGDMMDVVNTSTTQQSSLGPIKPEIRFRPTPSASASTTTPMPQPLPTTPLTQEEADLNPRANRDLKKQQKLKKKMDRKALRAEAANQDGMMDEALGGSGGAGGAPGVDEVFGVARQFAMTSLPGGDSDDDE
ncbi:P-loop containing nucleoside triphosphate hydrolase protein [Fimicolochytrium jonesii]|uniref:P-loop containing nucleoside triphosphate hydrolase protein n=1 Tax=Fimicolochytrium jonesii TaxID=1396493 RepID=UPI0022FE4D97|nr:P-loop containing nucleoside triphosphate hydrolase protein [Fimicolochytrium jonesii]KAI8824045.1 P-loop containing nucleoside triphosphate hydrolase protein [Fimicolochytrium jonesii]